MFNVTRFGLLALVAARLITAFNAHPRLFTLEDVPSSPVGVVFGAGLRRDGTPTTVLRERVAVAVDLYHAGKVDRLLMTGSVSGEFYNEPDSMTRYAIQLGVPPEAILQDYAGNSTQESCLRLHSEFGVENAILVTQSFHLPRALYLCDQYGVSASGVPAKMFNYRTSTLVIWNVRESVATLAMFWLVHFAQPELPKRVF